MIVFLCYAVLDIRLVVLEVLSTKFEPLLGYWYTTEFFDHFLGGDNLVSEQEVKLDLFHIVCCEGQSVFLVLGVVRGRIERTTRSLAKS